MSDLRYANERDVYSLLEAFSSRISPDERQEVAHFLEHAEWGVAFETLCGILIERHVRPTSLEKETILRRAKAMDVEPRFYIPLTEGG